MEREQLMAAVIATLQTIAPEVSAADLAPGEALRSQVDLDSMDWLNFLIGLHTALQVDIPESDYGRLRTLNELVDYLAARVA